MGTTYPAAPGTISGQNITVDRLVNDPVRIYRALNTLVQQRLIGDKLLTGRVDLTGAGSAAYEVAESIFPDYSAERVAALMEYPNTTDTSGTAAMANTEKWALASEISDEVVARNRMDQVRRKLIKLSNRLAFGFDALCLSAIGSAVTQTQAAGAAWSNASANAFLDILLGVAQSDSLNAGYVVDTLVLKPIPFARLLGSAPVLASLPRENGSPVVTGNLVQFAGLRFLKSTNLPPSVDAMVLDSTQLGSLGFEDLGGGYTGSARDGVQSKVFRKEANDGFRIQGRLVQVPMIQEPGAAVKITGV
jgi:hypothetical protein